tara:strand:+ start:746 stop:1006 length:261 start_codon:yes stop_codon:yes gene_type:complete
MYTGNRKGINMTTRRFDVEGELTEAGYDADGFLDELVYQISNLGVQWEYNDEAYKKYLQEYTLEEILNEAESVEMDIEEYKLDEDE